MVSSIVYGGQTESQEYFAKNKRSMALQNHEKHCTIPTCNVPCTPIVQ